MRKNLVPLLGIAFVVAIASTGIFYGLFVNKLRSPHGSRRTLVVAAHDLKPGTVLKEGDLKTMPWGAENLPKGFFSTVRAAVGSTAVEAIRQEEPVLRERLIVKDGGTEEPLGIPEGLRAVSVHVTDSTGVLALIRRGYKVDIQAVRPRDGGSGETEARTLLENVPVLSVGAVEASATGFMAPIVTVLARPQEADMLAVADAGARLRLSLRNPLDQGTFRPEQVSLAEIFRGRAGRTESIARSSSGSRRAHPAPAATQGTVAQTSSDQLFSLWVLLAAVDHRGVEEINGHLITPCRSGLLQVLPFRHGWDLQAEVQTLEERHQIQVISRTRLTAGMNRAASVQAGTYAETNSGPARETVNDGAACGIRIRLSPFMAAGGKLRLRVAPEVAAPDGGRILIRKAETETDLSDGQSFLISGLTRSTDRKALLERLFAGRDASTIGGMDLLVLVTPQRQAPVQTADLR